MTDSKLPGIDRINPTPIYKQLQDWMRGKITSGEWPEYYQLTSEIDLAASLGINRGTLRNAIQQLIEEGLLVRIHGKGTFVAANAVQQSLTDSLRTFSESLIDRNIPFETRVLSQKIIDSDANTASLLSVGFDDPIFYLERVRTVKGQAIVFLKNYLPHRLFNGIEQSDFVNNQLFKVMENQFQQQIAWGRRYFEARIAGDEVAAALNVSSSDPIMYAKQIVYRADNTPLEMSDIWFVGSYFRLSAVVNRHHALNILSGVPEVMQTEINV